jgi:hypothetical protein
MLHFQRRKAYLRRNKALLRGNEALLRENKALLRENKAQFRATTAGFTRARPPSQAGSAGIPARMSAEGAKTKNRFNSPSR